MKPLLPQNIASCPLRPALGPGELSAVYLPSLQHTGKPTPACGLQSDPLGDKGGVWGPPWLSASQGWAATELVCALQPGGLKSLPALGVAGRQALAPGRPRAGAKLPQRMMGQEGQAERAPGKGALILEENQG